MSEAWSFRDGTLDQAIFNAVVLFNEYELPARFAPGDIVIDVGAHIGSFAQAVLSRGCQDVTCVEPDRANFEIAAAHLKPHADSGHVRLVRAAAWRSDRNTDELFIDGYQAFPESFPGLQGIVNTGSVSVIWGGREPVPKLAFDEIVLGPPLLYTTSGRTPAVTVMVFDAPATMPPTLHVTTLPAAEQPGVPLVNVTSAGRFCTTLTESAGLGPLLVAVIE